MRTLCRFLRALMFVGAATFARAEIVYDNTTTYLTSSFPSLFEYGDDIRLAGTARTVTNFVFEYFGDFIREGDETARVRFYANDGVGQYSPPGTLLFDSGPFAIFTGQNASPLAGLNVTVPNTFTWTVEFGGVSGIAGDSAALVFYNPPTVGKSFRDFWMKKPVGGSNVWTINSFPNFDPVANFGARVSATETVAPAEPVKIKAQKKHSDGRMELECSALAGQRLAFEASTDLLTWTPLMTNEVSGTSATFVDAGARDFAVRFYRISVKGGL